MNIGLAKIMRTYPPCLCQHLVDCIRELTVLAFPVKTSHNRTCYILAPILPGSLSVKVKELIVLGILASRGLQYGVEAHMRCALDYGATKEELFEAIKAAAVPGGGVAYSVGVRALQTLKQDGAFPPPSLPPAVRGRRGTATTPPRAAPPATRRRGCTATR